MPVFPVQGNNAPSTNIGNFVAQIQGAAANPQAVPGDPLGVRTLGRNTGLALQQLGNAINQLASSSGFVVIDLTTTDSGVSFNGIVLTY